MRLVIAAVAALASGSAAAQPVPSLAAGEAVISVEAEGESHSRPDVMTISAGSITTGNTAADAVEANAALAQRLVAAIRGAGIEPRDVRTSQFAVEPRFANDDQRREELGPDGRPPRIVGYIVRNHLEVRLRDLSRADTLIGRLFEAGANSVSGPRFSLSDERPARRAAERAAIEEARAEAENYAAASGRRLGRLLRISDRRTQTDSDDEMIIVTGSSIRRTPIEPGEITTRTTVHVDFALAPQ
jgi:hypothetical protein